jgi:hypothetical protein
MVAVDTNILDAANLDPIEFLLPEPMQCKREGEAAWKVWYLHQKEIVVAKYAKLHPELFVENWKGWRSSKKIEKNNESVQRFNLAVHAIRFRSMVQINRINGILPARPFPTQSTDMDFPVQSEL